MAFEIVRVSLNGRPSCSFRLNSSMPLMFEEIRADGTLRLRWNRSTGTLLR
jgi:hypothetical protein